MEQNISDESQGWLLGDKKSGIHFSLNSCMCVASHLMDVRDCLGNL